MEVHPHSHHGKKKWIEYFWEFFMLFLAVTLGFFVENQREHYVENQRGKVYAQSLLNDLNADTLEVLTALKAERFRQRAMDSIISVSKTVHGKRRVPGSFYYYSRFVSNLYSVDWNSSTISQLVQAGNLRLLKNKNLIDKINAYYALQNTISRATQMSHERRMKILELRSKVLQSQYYDLFAGINFMTEQNNLTPSVSADSLSAQYPLADNSAANLDEYINLLIDWRWYLALSLDTNYPQIITDAKEIIQMLKEEFHLE